MKATALLCALLQAALAGPGAAGDDLVLPMLFEVSGGALNVRAGPDNGAEILGVVRASGGPLEVVAEDRTGYWGQVNFGARAGWIALQRVTGQGNLWTAGGMPEGMRCFGAAPVWAMRLTPTKALLSQAEAPDAAFLVTAVLPVRVPDEPWREIIAENPDMRLTGLMSPKLCGDGVSARVYGLSIDVVMEARQGGTTLLDGCCSVAP